jgi:CRISP-associated protein Cas1
MRTLYLSQQGCYLSLQQEQLVIQRNKLEVQRVQLPLIEQVLVFGNSQITTPAVRACLQRNIPIGYLSRLGYCYGRTLSIERGYRQLARYQQELLATDRLIVARKIVQAKIQNGRTLLLRQQRKANTADLTAHLTVAIDQLQHFSGQALQADNISRLMGVEGAAAATYFGGFGECLGNADFAFIARSRRPPGNPVNALLSFGYQVVWSHLLTLVELQGLDPYSGCLHQDSDRHAALVSDLIEEFRSPIVDSLVLYLVNRRMINAADDFEYRDGGCFLNEFGRKKYLGAFLQRMSEEVGGADKQPRWDLLNRQVKLFKQFVYQPTYYYEPYRIR